MTDFKAGGIPVPDYEQDEVTFFNGKTEFTDDVFVYGKLYAEFGGDVQTFSTAGVERVRITKDGRVGINTSAPPSWCSFSVDHGQFGLTRFSNHSHFLIQNKNASTSLFWSVAPRDDSSLDFARGIPEDNNGTVVANNDNTKLRINENGLVKGTLHTLIGEHSGATNVGELFSFGNGAVDNQGPAMPFAGKVIVVTISKSGGSNSGIFQPSKNGVTQGGVSDQITTTTGTGSVTKNNANYTSLMDFNAGDRINYVTVNSTDTSTCLTMFVRFDPV